LETGPGNNPTSWTGPGLNFEGAVGLTSHLELGFRQGIRLNDDARFAGADQYGRLYDTVTFGTGGDTLSNPEFRLTGAILNAEIVDIALEGRVVLPFAQHTYATYFGGMFGVLFLIRIPPIIRLDTGIYVAEFFNRHDPSNNDGLYDVQRPFLVAPGRLWFQVSRKVWLGPMTQITHVPWTGHIELLLGFGLGIQLSRIVDLKTQFYFPEINHDPPGTRAFGAGVGVQIRIE
jgi:hypothetical protein